MTCVLTACGVVHCSHFEILKFWRGNSVVSCNNIATNKVSHITVLRNEVATCFM